MGDRNMRIGSFNCQGIKEKIDYPDFLNLALSMDILGVCETWLSDKDDIFLPGFKFYPQNRKNPIGAPRGGVGIFIKNELRKHVKICQELSDEYFFWCKVDKNFIGYNEDVYICVVYIPPEFSSREKRLKLDHFRTLVTTTLQTKSNSIILLGDFNSRTGNLGDTLHGEKMEESLLPTNFFSTINTTRSNHDPVINNYGKKLIEFCIATNSYIVNGRTLGDFRGSLTCHKENGSSTVDYAVVSEKLHNKVQYFQVLDSSMGSDHCPIKIEIKKQTNTLNNKNKKTGTQIPKVTRWNDITKVVFLNKMKSAEMARELGDIDKMLDEGIDLNIVVEKLECVYVTKNNNPTKKRKKHPPKKWYDYSCHELSKQLKLTTKLLAKSPNNPHLRGSFCKTKKLYKKLLKKKKQEWKSSLISKLEELEGKDPQEYWKLVNQLRDKKQNESYFDADKFINFFENLFSKSDKDNNSDTISKTVHDVLANITKATESVFQMDELKKAIKALKVKSAGPIPVEMLKASPEPVLNILLKIINKIASSLQFPDEWASGVTSLLFKEGDDENPNDYRGITITVALSKIMAILINERLDKWSRDNNIQKKEQIGFTKKTRPGDHLLVLKTLIDSYKSSGRKLYTCFIDFQKAFDSVWRTGLMYKLIMGGVNLDMVKLIKCMYEKTSQCLKINNELTRKFKTYRGVRQGCILSPKLFNLFINDLPDIFDDQCDPVSLSPTTNINCLLYADDLVLLSNSPAGLQACLDRLQEYIIKWDLKINFKKTKIIVFQNGGRRVEIPFFIGFQKIDHTKSYKYLGTILSDTGSFKLNVNNLKKKGLRASFIISKNIGSVSKPSTSLNIYEKVIEPILLYNSEVTGACIPKTWDYDKFVKKMWDIGKELNKVTLGFLRQALGVHKKSSTLAILAETGKYPICISMFTRMIKYWVRLNNPDNLPLLKAARDLDTYNYNHDKPSWLRTVEYLRKVANVTDIPIDTPANINKLFKSFKQNLKQLFVTWWDKQKTAKPSTKLDFYYKHKKVFRYETYLNLPKSLRIYLTRLRVSSHCLPVEVQRYSKVKKDRSERKCTICNLDETGNETHLMLRCSNSEISHIRKTFFDNIRVEIAQLQGFTDENIIDYCLNLSDPAIHIPIAKYIKDITEMYKEETEGTRVIPDVPVQTKSGRLIKKPSKLNL